MSTFIIPQTIEPIKGGVISQWVQGLFEEGTWMPNLIACVLVFVQAFMINLLVSRNRLSSPPTLIPGVIYVLLVSSIPDFLYLSPILMANTFYISAMMALFETYKKQNSAGIIFNVGFWMGLGSLCYFPISILLMIVFVGLNSLRAFRLKEILMVLVGFFVPFFLTGVAFLWMDKYDYFLQQHLTNFFPLLNFKEPKSWEVYTKLGFFVALILLSLLSYSSYMSKKVIQAQKKISILYWAVFFGVLSFLIQSPITLEHLMILTLPLSIFLALRIILMKARIAESLHLILLVGILFMQYKYFWMLN